MILDGFPEVPGNYLWSAFASKVLPWTSHRCARSRSYHGCQALGMHVPVDSDKEENNFSVG